MLKTLTLKSPTSYRRDIFQQKIEAQIFSNSASAGIRRLVELAKSYPYVYAAMPPETEDTA